MLEVEGEFVASAGSLINDLAERILDGPPPAPGEPFRLGENLTVVLQPWQVVVPHVDPGSPGGAGDREQDDHGVHTGVRAVICDEKPRGMFRKLWVWPRLAIERLQNDQALIWKSSRATLRMATQARYTWGELATVFAKLRPHLHDNPDRSRAMVLAKASFPHAAVETGDETAEHMWLQILRFDGERLEGRLLNEPMFVAGVTSGDVMWIERDRLSEWRVMSDAGSFGPSDVAALWRAVDAIAASPGGEGGRR